MIDFTIARKNGGAIVWSQDQIAYIVEQYTKNNLSMKELAKRFHTSYPTIRRVLDQNNVKIDKTKRGYPRKSNYFSYIDNPEKAYWLGLLYADGTISKGNGKYEIRLELIDKEHIEKFKNAIGAKNHKISSRKDSRFPNSHETFYFSIKDKQMWEDLNKLGCVNNKSLILEKIPNIPRDYVKDFIRGYFDGDGSLHYLQNGKRYRISFAGQKQFLEDIRKELNMNRYGSLSQVKDGNCYQLQIAGRKQVKEILDYMYIGTDKSIRLDRKYEKYLDFLRRFTTELAHTRCE